MFETIVTKRTNAVRAFSTFVRTSPWFISVAAILALFLWCGERADQRQPARRAPRRESALRGISSVTATKWRAKAKGPPFIKVGRLVRYRRSDVGAWLRANAIGALAS